MIEEKAKTLAEILNDIANRYPDFTWIARSGIPKGQLLQELSQQLVGVEDHNKAIEELKEVIEHAEMSENWFVRKSKTLEGRLERIRQIVENAPTKESVTKGMLSDLQCYYELSVQVFSRLRKETTK